MQPAGQPVVGFDWFDLPPAHFIPYRLDQTWTFTYNKNLIGQDRLPTGEQIYDRPQLAQIPAENLKTWTWQYNKNLIGKDRLPAGEQVYELVPSQRVPEQIQLHSWQWSYNLNLIGKDRLPAGEQVYDRPTLTVPLIFGYTFQFQALLAPVIGPLGIVANQYSWPVPIAAQQPALWFQPYNVSLYFVPPVLDTTHVRRPIWRSLPDQPVQPLLQQSAFPNYLLLQPVTVIAKPFFQSDWPNPTQPYRIEQTWAASYNKNLISQDRLPFRQQDWPNPIPPALVKDWIQATNIALLTVAPALNITISKYYDRPQLAVPSAQSWEWSYNKNLIGQDQLPFRQADWPLTPAAQRAIDLATWIDRTRFLLTKPFAQLDWPNPIPSARDPTLTTVAHGYNLDLIGQDRLPNRQQDWPLPIASDPYSLRAYILALNIGLTTGFTDLTKIARQQYWPVPMGPIQPDRGFAFGSNPNLPPTPPPPAGPAVLNKPMLAGPGYLNVIPGEKPS
jgi:hypothetical protein